MKIGFSFGRCVRDIVKGDVAIEDVLCIIARTQMPTVEAIKPVIWSYMREPEYLWGLDFDTCVQVAEELYTKGKILQPRMEGIQSHYIPAEYVWMDLFPTKVGEVTEAVQNAWNQYRVLINLTESLPEEPDDLGPIHRRDPIYSAEDLIKQDEAVEVLIRHIV